MSACGSDATSTDPIDTTIEPSATAEAAPTTLPETTEIASTTTAPETVASTTTAPETTEAPTTTTATDSEPAGAEGALDFNLDGEPGATPTVFGYAALTEVDETALLDDVSEALGDVGADTGWVPMPTDYDCTGASEYRSLLWDDIRYVLARRDGPSASTSLAGWTIGDSSLAYSPPLAAPITAASGITTDDGIELGISADRLEGLDWDQSSREDDRFVGLAGLGPVIFQLDASDRVVGMSYEQNDC